MYFNPIVLSLKIHVNTSVMTIPLTFLNYFSPCNNSHCYDCLKVVAPRKTTSPIGPSGFLILVSVYKGGGEVATLKITSPIGNKRVTPPRWEVTYKEHFWADHLVLILIFSIEVT